MNGFTAIPNAIFSYQLPPPEFALYCALMSFTRPGKNIAYPAVGTLAAMVGVAPSTARRHIKSLQKRGLIHIRQRPGGSNYYTLPAVTPRKLNEHPAENQQGMALKMIGGYAQNQQGGALNLNPEEYQPKNTKQEGVVVGGKSSLTLIDRRESKDRPQPDERETNPAPASEPVRLLAAFGIDPDTIPDAENLPADLVRENIRYAHENRASLRSVQAYVAANCKKRKYPPQKPTRHNIFNDIDRAAFAGTTGYSSFFER